MIENIEIKFEKKAVAFIDVLGFSPLVDSTNKGKKDIETLQSLINALSIAIPLMDASVNPDVPIELIPEHTYISDCIILSAFLDSTLDDQYDGLDAVVMRAIQLSNFLIKDGYLLRGGIAVGDVWHTRDNIVGSAYQEAYDIEKNTLVPRIELSESAEEHWKNKHSQDGTKTCIQYRDSFMVNTLDFNHSPDRYVHGGYEAALKRYREITEKNIKSNLPDSSRYKWWWYREYLESVIEDVN